MGDHFKINPAKPPEARHIIQILLKNQSFPLKGTGCESGANNKSTLQHLLASTLGSAIDDGAAISAACESKSELFELRSGAMLDAWRCRLSIPEQASRGEWGSYTLFFGVRKDSWKLITDSITPNLLVCMP